MALDQEAKQFALHVGQLHEMAERKELHGREYDFVCNIYRWMSLGNKISARQKAWADKLISKYIIGDYEDNA